MDMHYMVHALQRQVCPPRMITGSSMDMYAVICQTVCTPKTSCYFRVHPCAAGCFLTVFIWCMASFGGWLVFPEFIRRSASICTHPTFTGLYNTTLTHQGVLLFRGNSFSVCVSRNGTLSPPSSPWHGTGMGTLLQYVMWIHVARPSWP